MKQTGMLVILLRSVDFECLALLRIFQQNPMFKLLGSHLGLIAEREKSIFLVILVSLKGHKKPEPCLN